MALEAIGSNPITHPIYFYVLGCSQVGKAPDFDSGIFAGSSPVSPAIIFLKVVVFLPEYPFFYHSISFFTYCIKFR